MTLTLHNATHMQASELDFPNISKALQRLVDRFPDDLTLEGIWLDIARGDLTMWLVRDVGMTVSVVLTEIVISRHTGHKRGMIRDMGGERAIEALPLIEQIHQWARERGAPECDVYGREGWKRPLIPYGYEVVAVTLRKRL